MSGPESEFVEVAVPVPLRRLYTYRVPESLQGRLKEGSRVAVPFSRRKVAGIVVGFRKEAPEGVSRVFAVSGLLEERPLFPPELLRFLLKATDYYFAPVGEVLRAAAPALPKGAMKRLRASGALSEDEELKGAAVGKRLDLFLTRSAHDLEGIRLGQKQRSVLERLDETEATALKHLREQLTVSRSVVRRLEELGLITVEEREVFEDPFFGVPVQRDEPPPPHPAQKQAVTEIVAKIEANAGASFLLHGVTGSGKTEVYLQVIGAALEKGKTGLVLVPEIALTPQLVGRFRARFGDEIAVLHSALKAREKNEFWRRLRGGELRVAIGACSALFAPLENIGVIVVDEEHDSSFKQEEGFRYHARDMALMRAHLAGAVCVLGSATPSLESYHLTRSGKMHLLKMPERATSQALPKVEMVDLRRFRKGPSGQALLSTPLHQALQACLAAEEQAILFLNRRGFSPSLQCESCGTIAPCPACSVPLTEHRGIGRLRCHYCDFSRPVGGGCTECSGGELKSLGLGTEQLQTALEEGFPGAKVGRLDRDTASGSRVVEVLDEFRAGRLNILVGTQMVTKGHDLPGVTLVGVILADQPLGFPDFRASERCFQLLAQVAGRAGRGEREGRVICQTYQPEHASIQSAALHDYESFVKAEYPAREELGYPPFSRLIAIRVDAGDEGVARATARGLAQIARDHEACKDGRVEVLGPAAAPIARLRGRYRFRLLLRGADRKALRRVGHCVGTRIQEGVAPARASVDVDPVAML